MCEKKKGKKDRPIPVQNKLTTSKLKQTRQCCTARIVSDMFICSSNCTSKSKQNLSLSLTDVNRSDTLNSWKIENQDKQCMGLGFVCS